MDDREKNPLQVRLIQVITLLIFSGFSIFFFLLVNNVIKSNTERETQMYALNLEKELDSCMSGSGISDDSSDVLHLLRIYTDLNELDLIISNREGLAVNSAIEGILPGDLIFMEKSLLSAYKRELTEEGILRFTDGKWIRGDRLLPTYCIIKPVIGTDDRLIVLARNQSIYRSLLIVFSIFTAVIVCLYLLTVLLFNHILSTYRNRIIQLATIDELTGLANRKSFVRQYDYMRKSGDLKGAILFMTDIDSFKRINDAYGHNAGDQALALLAGKIRSFMNGKCIAGRWGGDEFIGVFVDGKKKSEEKLTRLLTEVRETGIRLENGEEIHFSMSLGAALIGEDMDLKRNIEKADLALYESKKKGKNCLSLNWTTQ